MKIRTNARASETAPTTAACGDSLEESATHQRSESARDALVAFETGDEKSAIQGFRSAIENLRQEEDRWLALRTAEERTRLALSLTGLALFGMVTFYIAVAAWGARREADTIAGLADRRERRRDSSRDP